MISAKVLIIDDIPDWRKTLSGLLQDQGYDVESASSVDSALEKLGDEKYHVVISDIRLDESNVDNRDGLLLMHQIKENWPSIQVIVLTGYAEVSMVQEVLAVNEHGRRPAYSFLEKTQTNVLLEHVKRACENNIRLLVAQGETETVEFQSSIRWDYQSSNVNKRRQYTVAKTIAGMMNNKGGTLVIGIADDGSVLGIELDLQTLRKPTVDQFEILLVSIIENFLGIEKMKLLVFRFEQIDERTICILDIAPSFAPIFLKSNNQSEFWVRFMNSTRQLDVKESVEFITTHWDKR